MPRVKAAQLSEGMVVVRDVKNIDGMLLVGAGTALSARQIDILQSWGVADAEIEGGDQFQVVTDPLAQLSSEVLAKLSADLQARFWQSSDFGTVQSAIFNQILHRLARRGGADPKKHEAAHA